MRIVAEEDPFVLHRLRRIHDGLIFGLHEILFDRGPLRVYDGDCRASVVAPRRGKARLGVL
jgi:hypothetical protein